MPRRSVGSLAPFACRMNVRRMPNAPPNSPASNTTLSRGEAWPVAAGSDGLLVQSSWANTNAAKSTSPVSSTSRSSVDTPGLKTVVHGSTSATSASPRVRACTSFACLPEEPRKMRGFIPAIYATCHGWWLPRNAPETVACDGVLVQTGIGTTRS